MKMTCILLAAAFLSLPARAADGKTTCKKGGVERLVTIAYAEAGKKAPCEVKYKRDAEAEEKTIYQARAEEGFCEKKAQEFIEKLKGLGFECAE
jgi:hypothetical protein